MVAVTIAATFFYIKQHPRVLRLLEREIRTTFGPHAPTNGPNLDSCIYLRACVDEALRMAPPGPGVFWRTSASHHTIDGVSLPPGTEFGVCIYALHYNNAIFDEPEIYKPERMTRINPESSSTREGLIPFLRGFRACPAQKLAYATILLPIARLLWEFNLDSGQPKSEQEATLTVSKTQRVKQFVSETSQLSKVFPQVDVFGSHITGPLVSFSPLPKSWNM